MSETNANLSRIGAFALEERLGQPPADSVYRGVHIERRESFAIRLLPAQVLGGPLAEKTFKEEVAALKQLIHPRIVRCYGGSIDRGRPFLALELVAGESVAEQLARRGRLPWETAIEITEQICQALAYAHARNMLHERLAPEKVLFDEAGGIKLCGFGSAWSDRYIGRSPQQLPLAAARYLAPEQLAGDLPVTSRSDLYGVGANLFMMVTGRPPFNEAENMDELIGAKRLVDPPRISAFEFNAPVWLDVLASRLLAPLPTDRFTSAGDVVHAIAETRRNVQSGVSTAQRALASRSATLVPAADREELERIRRKRVRKKVKIPFYERAWFLAASLALVVAVIAWAVWPAGEEALYREAAALMASDDPVDWYRAKEDYIDPLRERFPDGAHAEQVQAWLDKIEMEQAENRLRLHAQLGKPPSSEAERLYAEAWRYEQFGDRITALDHYHGLIQLLADSPEKADRAFVNLARQRVTQITEGGNAAERRGDFDRAAFLREHLDEAARLAEAGQLLAARRIWESIVSLYSGNRELEPLVEEARAQLE